MGFSTIPPGLNNSAAESKLKLLSVAGLPANSSATSTSGSIHAGKKNLHTQAVELSDEEKVEVSKLKAMDIKVHQHEQAHLSASAGLNVSHASFTYQKGPNGVNYAVAGEVKIDASSGRTPEETLARAEKIADAALAPADPSAADRSVAAKAQNMAQQARVELMQQGNAVASKQTDRPSVYKAYENSVPVSKIIDTYV